jgi:hypothetical protein
MVQSFWVNQMTRRHRQLTALTLDNVLPQNFIPFRFNKQALQLCSAVEEGLF